MNALRTRALAPLVALLLLPIACSGTEIETSPMTNAHPTATSLPPIDLAAPTDFHTATFALG